MSLGGKYNWQQMAASESRIMSFIFYAKNVKKVVNKDTVSWR